MENEFDMTVGCNEAWQSVMPPVGFNTPNRPYDIVETIGPEKVNGHYTRLHFGGSNILRGSRKLQGDVPCNRQHCSFRAGESTLAAALVAERREVKPSPFTRALSERASVSTEAA